MLGPIQLKEHGILGIPVLNQTTLADLYVYMYAVLKPMDSVSLKLANSFIKHPGDDLLMLPTQSIQLEPVFSCCSLCFFNLNLLQSVFWSYCSVLGYSESDFIAFQY